jgi:uncharacterized protein
MPDAADLRRATAHAPEEREPADIEAKRRRLIELLRSYGRVAVAMSAGVDSTVVAQAATIACGDRAMAFTAESPSLPEGELEAAQQLAAAIGIRHVIVRTEEFQREEYLRNPANRCYFCKTELYGRLAELRAEYGFDVIVNGANLDDLGDHRPGMQAASEHAVRSPLVEAGCTKSDVRALARHWKLPVHDKPAAPCLSSRIAYGVAVTSERVRRIDRAERWLRERLGVRELRVRLEEGDLARIELPLAELPQALEETVRSEIVDELKGLGFRRVTIDLEGFRSGSLNATLQPHELVTLKLPTKL